MVEGGKCLNSKYRDATASYKKLPSARPWERVQRDACFYVIKGRLVLTDLTMKIQGKLIPVSLKSKV